MDYDRIILEMLDRIKTLEEQMAELRGNAGTVSNDQSDKTEIKASKKYRRLTELLDASHERTVSLTFDEIEKTIGFSLPGSAREHRAFWANTTTHSIALSWLSIGYKTVDVNMNMETVVFER